MASIYDLITPQDIAAYYSSSPSTEPPFLGETLFPAKKQMGIDLAYIKGAHKAQVALRPAAFDTNVIPRGRHGFSEIRNRMPFYKESTYVDEEQRQKLLLVANSNNPAYQDVILNNVFDNITELLTAAKISREIVRMQALTTGKAIISGNDISHSYDYFMPEGNIATATTPWNVDGSNPLADIKTAKRYIAHTTGATLTRAVVSQTTWDTLLANKTIRDTILNPSANAGAIVLDTQLQAFLQSNTQMQFAIYDKGYVDVSGKFHQFIPDGTVVFLPAGDLGNTWFGTTPEEADLMSIANVANVSLVDMGVAITTMAKPDPVTVETKVSQITLPSFEQADNVYVLNGVIGDTSK